jgi:hypothetical protein
LLPLRKQKYKQEEEKDGVWDVLFKKTQFFKKVRLTNQFQPDRFFLSSFAQFLIVVILKAHLNIQSAKVNTEG